MRSASRRCHCAGRPGAGTSSSDKPGLWPQAGRSQPCRTGNRIGHGQRLLLEGDLGAPPAPPEVDQIVEQHHELFAAVCASLQHGPYIGFRPHASITSSVIPMMASWVCAAHAPYSPEIRFWCAMRLQPPRSHRKSRGAFLDRSSSSAALAAARISVRTRSVTSQPMLWYDE